MNKYEVLLFIINFKKSFFKFIPFDFFPINQKKIVFSNYFGLGYGCNPKYIAELLRIKHPEYKIVWLVNPKNGNFKFPKGIKKVDINSLRAFYELSSAKIWVDNYHKVFLIKKGLKKRPNQYFIQTWHGSLGIKKIEADVNALNTVESWKKASYQNALMQDYLLSNSAFEDNVYKSAFMNKGKILRIGHARNDIFFKDNKKNKEKILKAFNLSSDTNILLYVPTFRQGFSLDIYDIDYERLRNSLIEKFGGNWVIFIRLHRNIKAKLNLENSKYLFDLSSYDDVQELLASCDAAITDYSSCIFDFVLTKRPAFIYAPDIEKYDKERGFYYSIYDTPFLVAKNNDELMINIKNFDNDIYLKKVEDFLLEKGCIDDGNASKRAVELIENLMDKKKE